MDTPRLGFLCLCDRCKEEDAFLNITIGNRGENASVNLIVVSSSTNALKEGLANYTITEKMDWLGVDHDKFLAIINGLFVKFPVIPHICNKCEAAEHSSL